MRGCIELKIGKVSIKLKTIIKLVLFLVVATSIAVMILKDDSEMTIDPTQPPELPDPDSQELDGEGIEELPAEGEVPIDAPIDVPEVEQFDIDDLGLENRPTVIEEKQEEIDDHQFRTENETLELYVKEENLSIILREKETGAVMYSTVKDPVDSNEEWMNFMKSPIVMEYLVGTNIVTYRADMYSQNPEKELNFHDSGFDARISYPDLEISYQFHVTLTESGISVEIPQESIVEESDRYKVSGFYVYPFLGYSKLGEREGYMFIPDGSGALIHLKDNDGRYRQPFSKMVYGDNVGIDDSYVLSLFNRMNPYNDPEKILAPVFGMVQTDSELGYLGIIEEGQYSARIEAYPSGAILPYNWITTKFIYRQVYNQPTSQESGTMVVRQRHMNEFDIKVRYEFVSQDQATYFGLAEVYRDYLLSSGAITKKGDDFQLRVDFFGADVEDGLIFKNEVPMTTFSQAVDILDNLQQSGVNQILSTYKGWQNKGFYGGLPIRSFKPESSLEDDITLEDLLVESEQRNIDMFLYHDALRANPDENRGARYKTMKKFNKRTYNEEIYGNVYDFFHYLQPESTASIMERMKSEYQRNDVENVLISGISNELFSYSERSNEYDRIRTKNFYESTIAEYAETFDLLLEQPFAYLWKYTDAFIDLPMSSSNYVFTDEDIPFIALTLKGIVPMYSEYTNFQANQREFFLKLVEQGVNPSFYITYEDPSALLYTNSSHIYSSKFERYEDTIVEYYEELSSLHEFIHDAVIIDYERIGQITKVMYENGTVVYVNYSEESGEVDGYEIEGLSYKVVSQS